MGAACATPPAGTGKPVNQIKIYSMPPSMNSCGANLLAMDLGIGGMEFLNLMEGKHKEPEYLKINPYGVIPGLQEGDFSIGESCCVLRYMAMAYGQKYYPCTTNVKKCGMIDFALDAFSNVAKPHMNVVYPVYGFGPAPDDQPAANKVYTEAIQKWLDIHVKNGPFVLGSEISIADFKAIPFFYSAMQPATKKLSGYDPLPKMVNYVNAFMAKVPACKFMEEAGGFSLKEIAASKM